MHFLTPDGVAVLAGTIDRRFAALGYAGKRAELAALRLGRVDLLAAADGRQPGRSPKAKSSR